MHRFPFTAGSGFLVYVGFFFDHFFVYFSKSDLPACVCEMATKQVILGGFGGSKSVIFGIDFLMIFACRSKIAPRAAKSSPRAPKSLPRASQERPRATQEHPRAPQERPRGAQERPRAAKSAPRAPKSGPRVAKGSPRRPESGPRAAKSLQE